MNDILIIAISVPLIIVFSSVFVHVVAARSDAYMYTEVMGNRIMDPITVAQKYPWIVQYAFSQVKFRIIQTDSVFYLQRKLWGQDWVNIGEYPHNYDGAAQDFSYVCTKHKAAIQKIKQWPRVICTSGGYWR